jgi:hypothetical protein
MHTATTPDQSLLMQFTPRKLLFKAWNKETRLLMRLNSIDCVRGELVRKDHILLQFTGLYDKQNEEIYEMDMVLIGGKKFVVCWDTMHNGWSLTSVAGGGETKRWVRELSDGAVRICSYFESETAS